MFLTAHYIALWIIVFAGASLPGIGLAPPGSPSIKGVVTDHAGATGVERGLPIAERPAPALPPATAPPPLSVRVVHRFDFDERGKGNLEPLPKYWIPLPHPNFSNFSEAGFDFEVGHSAPPSFYLGSAGRDTAYQYTGPATRVRPGVQYRIEGFVRPDRLRHARACLSAAYLDADGTVLTDTLVRSEFLGAAANVDSDLPPLGEETDRWLLVEFYLDSAPPEAVTITLIAWLLQEATWDTSPQRRRPIQRVDVNGGAWFDDITVYALPQVEMRLGQKDDWQTDRDTAAPVNLITDEGPNFLHVRISDRSNDSLTVSVHVRAADPGNAGIIRASPGRVVATQSVVTSGFDRSVTLPLGNLSPGLYHAHLDISAGEARIVSRSLTFARLAPRRSSGRPTMAFGIALDPILRAGPEADLVLLRNQLVHSAKIPVWPGIGDDLDRTRRGQGSAQPGAAGRDEADALLLSLSKDGFALTAVLSEPPRMIAERYGGYTRSVFDLLRDDSTGWEPMLAAAAAPYAGVFRWWDLGSHRSCATPLAGQLDVALQNLREALRPYAITPRLGITVHSADAGALLTPTTNPARSDSAPPSERVTILLGVEQSTDAIRDLLESHRSSDREQTAVLVEPLPEGEFERLGRLGEWAKRVISARHAGADAVYAPQTWDVRVVDRRRVAEPREEYLVLRTIADLVGDAVPGPMLDLGDGVRCLSFFIGEEATLAMWDEFAPSEGRTIAVQLGRASAQFDLWGGTTPLPRDETGRHVITLHRRPTLISGVDRYLIQMAAGLQVAPQRVGAGEELVRHSIEWDYAGLSPVSGECELEVPPSWDATPRSFRISLMPGRREVIPVTIRYSHNDAVGTRKVVVKVRLDHGPYAEFPLRIEIAPIGLEVRGAAIVEGKDLVLQQTVRNASTEPVHLRGFAAVPGRERQYRPFTNLLPGTVQTAEYRFENGADLTGRRVLLSFRELNDRSGMQTIELWVP